MSECGGCFCCHPTAVWALWIHDLNKEGPRDRWTDRTRYTLAPEVESSRPEQSNDCRQANGGLAACWTKHSAVKLTPNVRIRAHVLQPHTAVPLPPLAPEVRQVRRAPLRRTDFEQFGYTDKYLGCANARAGRQQAVDHSEHCRSRMEAILVTTTEGHERSDRFALAAKEREEEPQRRRGAYQEGGMTGATVEQHGQSGRHGEHPEALKLRTAASSSTALAERSLEQETETDQVRLGTTGTVRRGVCIQKPSSRDSSSCSSRQLKWMDRFREGYGETCGGCRRA